MLDQVERVLGRRSIVCCILRVMPQALTKTAARRTKLLTSPRTHTKRSVLSLLAEYFCLRPPDVAVLLSENKPTEADHRRARRTLLDLYQTKWLNRLPYFELDREKGGVGYVYGLSDKAVAEFGGKTFDEHSQRTLDHELEISFFHIALKNYCHKNDIGLAWYQRDLKRGIHPDALFKFTTEKGETRFFLEIEKQRMNGAARRCSASHQVHSIQVLLLHIGGGRSDEYDRLVLGHKDEGATRVVAHQHVGVTQRRQVLFFLVDVHCGVARQRA